jgi:hypothetical protein
MAAICILALTPTYHLLGANLEAQEDGIFHSKALLIDSETDPENFEAGKSL